MIYLLLLLLCIYFYSIALAVPYPAPLILRMSPDIDSTSVGNVAQPINATIMDHAGHDITSAFDVMVFYDSTNPSNKIVHTNDTNAANNGTNSLIDRRSPLFYRQISQCTTPNTIFISSECSPADNKEGSLQAYTITCHRNQEIFHPYTGEFLYTLTFPVQRTGHCSRDEICVNGGSPSDGALNGYGIKFAYCVQRRAFQTMSSKSPLGLNLNKQSVKNDLEGKRLSMVVSKKDLSTPLEVDSFDVETEVVGDENPGAADKCRDCMELETQQFQKGTESLKAEARMLTTGATAGVLWLAIMSG